MNKSIQENKIFWYITFSAKITKSKPNLEINLKKKCFCVISLTTFNKSCYMAESEDTKICKCRCWIWTYNKCFKHDKITNSGTVKWILQVLCLGVNKELIFKRCKTIWFQIFSQLSYHVLYIPCIFLLWNLGDPRKLFLMLLKRDRQWAAEGDPGGVGKSPPS